MVLPRNRASIHGQPVGYGLYTANVNPKSNIALIPWKVHHLADFGGSPSAVKLTCNAGNLFVGMGLDGLAKIDTRPTAARGDEHLLAPERQDKTPSNRDERRTTINRARGK